MTSPRRSSSIVLLASALVLAACGGGSGDGSASDDDTGASTDSTVETDVAVTDPVATDPAPVVAEPEPEPVATDVASTEAASVPTDVEPVAAEAEPVAAEPDPAEAESSPAEPDVSGGDDGACLVGEWVLTDDELNKYYDAVEASIAETGPAVSFDIDGDVLLTFGETDYAYVADFDLTLGVAGQSGNGATNGTVTGTWDVVDDLIVTTLGSSDLDVVISVSGVTISGSDLANGVLNSAPINNAPFDCAGPTIGFQINEADGLRHDVLLTPA